MRTSDVAGDCKSQADPASLQVASLIQAVKRAERFLAPLLGDSGAIVFDGNLDTPAHALDADLRAPSVFQRDVDEIGQAALQRLAPNGEGQGFDGREPQSIIRVVRATLVRHSFLNQGGELDSL